MDTQDGLKHYLLMMGEEAVEIIAAIAALVIIGRFYDSDGLGVYSFLLSVFIIVSHLSEVGVRGYVEREVALGGKRNPGKLMVIDDGFRAALATGAISSFPLVLFGYYHASRAQIAEDPSAYLIIAAAIICNNYNGVRKAALHGAGRHPAAAWIGITKHLVMVGAVFFLSLQGLPASLLTLAFLAAEAAAVFTSFSETPRFSPLRIFSGWTRIPTVFREGLKEIFTESTFRIVLYLDFFVLGIFVPAWELGVYSEASVLARLFLIIPLGGAPVFHHRFCRLAAERNRSILAEAGRKTAARLFFLHSLLGLYILIFFPQVLWLLFGPAAEPPVSFRIFSGLMPGLLFFGSASILEAFYQVEGKSAALSRLAFRIFLLNAFLNFYLVPYAGHYGAAAATAISLTTYFILFGRSLPEELHLPRGAYLLAGCLVFLCYELFSSLHRRRTLAAAAMPLVLAVLFYLAGFFNAGESKKTKKNSKERDKGNS